MWKCWLTIWQITSLSLYKYRTSQMHEVLAISWCIFSGPHRRIPRIIFCEISVYLLVIPMISILLYIMYCYPLFRISFGALSVGIPWVARFYSFLPKAHLRSSPHWSFAISSLLGLWKMWQKRILTLWSRMVCTVYVLVCVGGFHFQPPNWWCMVIRNMARNMYQKVNIQVDKIQKGHGTWADEAPEVFGTDQLEIQTSSAPSVSFRPMVGQLHGIVAMELNWLRDVMFSPDFPTVSWL